MQGAREEFERAGVDVVLIGQATPTDAADFRRNFDLDLPILADERRVSYKAVGAKHAGLTGIFGPKVVLRGVRTILGQRVTQGRTVGSSTQLGAAFVIAPGGEVLFEQLAGDVSDNAPPDQLLAAASGQPQSH